MLAIRLARTGKKKKPTYRVVVIEKRRPRNGRFVEVVGTYDPLKKPAEVKLNADRIKYWLGVGAKPSEKVEILFKKYMAKFEEQGAAAAPPPAAKATASST